MGNFYTNVTLKTGDRNRVIEFLRSSRREAYVSNPANGFVAICDAETESQDEGILCGLASSLSRNFAVPALAVLNHDDDILCYYLFDRGSEVDRYNSCPGYFEGDVQEPDGGDSSLLVQTLGARCTPAELDAILRAAEPALTGEQMAQMERIQKDFAVYQEQIKALFAKHPSLLQNPDGPGGAEMKAIQEKIEKEITSKYSSFAGGGKYAFAVERHTDLIRVLGLPECAVGTGYNYLKEGDAPVEEFEHT